MRFRHAFRFTIRDGLFLTATIAVALAWWIDHRYSADRIEKLEKQHSDLRTENLDLAFKLIAEKSLPKDQRVRELLDAVKKSTLSSDEAEEVFLLVRHDPDFRVRVRAMTILPHVRERDDAIDVLLEALRQRTGEKAADGVIPQYAAKYLAHMKATRAIGDVKGWLAFLKEEKPYDDEARPVLIKTAEKNLAELIAAAEATAP